MRRLWVALGVLLLWMCSLPVGAQQPAPEAQPKLEQQQKSQQYLRIEYERCRADLVELWVKGDAEEKRVKDLEAEVQKLTAELTTLRSKVSEKPSH